MSYVQLYRAEDMARLLNCAVEDLDDYRQRGEIDSISVTPHARRYGFADQRPAGESNPATKIRSLQSGFAGQAKDARTYQDRREYLRTYQRAWIAKRRAEFFAEKVCVDCGAATGLELHHRDPAEKVDHAIWSWSDERREAEIAKCDVVCVDCHQRRHGKTPGGRHGGKHRYEHGCRCELCVNGQRHRDQRKRQRRKQARLSPVPYPGGER